MQIWSGCGFCEMILIIFLTLNLVLNISSETSEYNGVFCGMLKEINYPGKIKNYNCFGSIWAIDKKRLKVKGFVFQPSFWQQENVTFWIGPVTKTNNEFHDMMPSENGIYLEPEIVVPQFLLDAPQTIYAKRPTTQEVLSIFLPKKTKTKDTINKLPILVNPNPSPEPEPGKQKTDKGASKINPLKTKPVKLGLRLPSSEPEPGIKSQKIQSKPEPEPSPKKSKEQSQDTVKNNTTLVTDKTSNRYSTTTTTTTKEMRINDQSNSFDSFHGSSAEKYPEWQDPFNFTIDFEAKLENLTDIIFQATKNNFHFIPNLEFELDSSNSSDRDILNITMKDQVLIIESNSMEKSQNHVIKSVKSLGKITIGLAESRNDSSFDQDISNTTSQVQIEKEMEVSESATYQSTTAGAPAISQTPRSWRTLSWHANSDIVLNLPMNRILPEFRWLSVWDHANKKSIATVLLPNGRRFSYPSPLVVKGFKANLATKDIRSDSIEIVDTKTIRIRRFTFEGDAPGAWFMVGNSLFPTIAGRIVPILQENGGYDCNFIKSYENEDVILKLPGTMKANEVFWLSVFCIPYSISFAHVYLPFKDMTVPMASDNQTVPTCTLE